MYVHEGYGIGDAWYFTDEDAGIVHMFYLTGALNKGGPRGIGHAVSRDLFNWETLPLASRPGPPGSWDDFSMLTGSVIKYRGRYWMSYGATSTVGNPPGRWVQRAGMAVSDDLVTWQKLPECPLSQAGSPYYEQKSTGQRENYQHWRDQFLFVKDDVVYEFICARRTDGDVATRGTVAVARSTDMRSWEVLPPIEHDRVAEEMEIPQVYRINGRWYLLFTTLGRLLSPEFASRFQGEVPEQVNLCMVGDSPFGPFHIHGTGRTENHAPDAYFMAAQLAQLHGDWYLLATIHDEVSKRISDPVPVYADETGVHART